MRTILVLIKALDMYRFFHPLSLYAMIKTLSDKEYVILNEFKIERRKGKIPYDWLDSIDKLHITD